MKSKVINYIHSLYILEMLIATIYMWMTANFKEMGYGGYTFFTAALLISGFKFDLFPGRTKRNYFIDRFSNPLLNVINWGVQWFGYIYIVYTVGLQSFREIFSPFRILCQNGQLTFLGILITIVIAILILWPFITTITIVKSHNPYTTVIQSIEISMMYLIFMVLSFESVMMSFGKLPEFLSDAPIISIFLFIIPFVYINLQKNQLTSLLGSRKKSLNKHNQLILIVFLAVIFLIDSAVWLHPFSSWQIKGSYVLFALRSGIGEELIFRLLVFSLLIFGFQKYRKGIIWALCIQALLFGSMHLFNFFSTNISLTNAMASIIDASGIGLVFGILYLITRNIMLPMVIHVIWDMLQSIVTGAGNISISGVNGLILAMIVFTCCFVYASYLYKKLYVDDSCEINKNYN